MKTCLGCGAPLQYKNINELGYTEKKENNLCERCFKLKNYGIYKSVPLTNKDYEQIINSISKNAKVLYITDVLSLDCPQIESFDNITLVITKKDLLPKSTKKEKIITYIRNIYPTIANIHFISSKTEEGLDTLYNEIKQEKEIYLIGTTNSGKSTLINKLIKKYGNDSEKDTITVSMYPSTTLNKIEIKLNNLTLIDTPGLINKNNITNYLSGKYLKQITPKKEIKPKTCQLEGKGSILIDNYAKIDYDTINKTSIVIYASNQLNIHFASKKNKALYNQEKYEFNLEKNKDIVIPGLCFIKCKDKINLNIYTINNIKPISRNNLI